VALGIAPDLTATPRRVPARESSAATQPPATPTCTFPCPDQRSWRRSCRQRLGCWDSCAACEQAERRCSCARTRTWPQDRRLAAQAGAAGADSADGADGTSTIVRGAVSSGWGAPCSVPLRREGARFTGGLAGRCGDGARQRFSRRSWWPLATTAEVERSSDGRMTRRRVTSRQMPTDQPSCPPGNRSRALRTLDRGSAASKHRIDAAQLCGSPTGSPMGSFRASRLAEYPSRLLGRGR
jgi:hypothetical protein